VPWPSQEPAELARPRRPGQVCCGTAETPPGTPLSACGVADGDGAVCLGWRRLRYLAAPLSVDRPLGLGAARPSGDGEVEDAANLQSCSTHKAALCAGVGTSVHVHQWEGRPSVCRAYAVLAPCWRPSGALTDTQHRLLGCLDLGPQSTTRRNPAGLVRLRLPGRAPPYDECGGDGPTDWRALDRH
jgi:hypothetical protein